MKKLFDFYEDFIGVKEVRKTQEAVLKTESEFVESSKARLKVQNEMIGLQQILKQVRHQLDSTHRSDELYLPLITKEHQLLKSEIQMIDSLRSLEENERHLFSKFSQKLRDAHEVERLRQEKSKYLSLLGSIIGACLGIIAMSINHAFKRKDLKKLAEMIEVRNSSLDLAHNSSTVEITQEKPVLGIQTSIETQTDDKRDDKNEDKIVEIISMTESNLEYKMKINSLTTVVATYALIAITLPIIIRLISD